MQTRDARENANSAVRLAIRVESAATAIRSGHCFQDQASVPLLSLMGESDKKSEWTGTELVHRFLRVAVVSV